MIGLKFELSGLTTGATRRLANTAPDYLAPHVANSWKQVSPTMAKPALCWAAPDPAKGYPFEALISGGRPGAVLADQVKKLDWMRVNPAIMAISHPAN